MNYNPSPKSELVKNISAIKDHHELVEDPVLRKHLEVAMQEMQRRAVLVDAANFNLCASAHLRMLGAQEFVDTFLNLAETSVSATRTDTANLAGNIPTRKN